MKRIFIAVGSEGLKALSALIGRLNEEGIFHQFNDKYIAVDSAKENVDAFQSLQLLYNTDRIKSWVLTIKKEKDGVVMESFRKSWHHNTVPPGGVGGNRAISGKASASVIKDIWYDEDFSLDRDLGTDDQIIVMGSAFGGTSGGLFLNFCEFLDLQIRNKRQTDNEYKNVSVLGFLLMPEAVYEGDNANYAIALNMIDMFRDLQTVSWQRRLESRRNGFKVPVWSQIDKDGVYFPLFTKTSKEGSQLVEYGISGSTLPMSILYLVPTPKDERKWVTALFAESVFAATYLNLDPGHEFFVNRLEASGKGPANEYDVEDNCLAGFNMFVMKSGRLGSLKRWFNDAMVKTISGTAGRGGLLSEATSNDIICNNIVETFANIQVGDRDKEYAGVARETLEQLLNEFDQIASLDSLKEFKKNSVTLIKPLQDEVPNFTVYSAKTMIAALGAEKFKSWNSEINFSQIKRAYTQFYSELVREIDKKDFYRDKLDDLIKKSIKYLENRLRSRVIKDTPLGLGIEDLITKEVLDAFKAEFKKALKSYLFSLRCNRSNFITDFSFGQEVDRYKESCHELLKFLSSSENKDGENPYIIDGKVVDLKLPSNRESELKFNPMRILLLTLFRKINKSGDDSGDNKCLVEILQRMNDNADLIVNTQMNYMNVIDKAQESIIDNFITICESLNNDNNPLNAATLKSFEEVKGRCRTFSPSFKLEDTEALHYHFCVKCGKIPDNLGLKNEYVSKTPLFLDSMVGMNDLNADFFQQDHRTNNKDSWKTEENTDLFPGRTSDKFRTQGLWLGTLGIDFTPNEVLNKLYASYGSIKSNWIQAGISGTFPTQLMTTVEMVRFGLIIEAIEETMNKEWAKYREREGQSVVTPEMCKEKVTIRFKKGEDTCLELPSGTLVELGFANFEESIQLKKIRVPWVGAIFDWIRAEDDEKGFRRMLEMTEADFRSIERAQINIFDDLRFHINPDEIKDMDKVKRKLASMIEISFV